MESEESDFVNEVLRINARFVSEVVEGYNFCPYAKGARVTNRSARAVLLQRDADVTATVALIAKTQREENPPEVLQVIYPRIGLELREFEHFHRAVRDGLRAHLGHNAEYVQASFHPDYPCNMRNPETLVTFLRKSPDPMIQFLLVRVMEAVRGEEASGTLVIDPNDVLNFDLLAPRPLSTSQRIARDNHARVTAEGAAVIEKALREIRDDRDRSYARFGA